MHIFIKNGLEIISPEVQAQGRSLRILEVGLGTGLNLFLTFLYTQSIEFLEINYTGVEKYPLNENEIKVLNYPQYVADSGIFKGLTVYKANRIFKKINELEWGETLELNKNFTIHKVHSSIEDFLTNDKYDLIYFDAFSPGNQPELWTNEIFAKLASLSVKGTLLVTYSSKGTVKELLRANGFEVKRFNGINGKRHNLSARFLL